MGTPDFAAASLNGLLENGFDVCGVFTQPDKPKNRGMKLVSSPVKELALSRDIPVFQPVSMRDGEALKILEELSPDLIVVVAFGKILPDEILNFAPKGCINVHGSLLPKYRGSSPIQWAVLNGDAVSGVTTMYMAHDVDAGDIIYTSETEIGEFETSGELFDRLSEMGAELLCKTVTDIENGTAPRIPQNHNEAVHVGKLSPDMSPIDWNKTPRQVIKWIYGMNPWPAATMELDGVKFKVFGAAFTENKTDKAPGMPVSVSKHGLEMACAGGETVMITQWQAPGGKRMAPADYLRGHKLDLGGIN